VTLRRRGSVAPKNTGMGCERALLFLLAFFVVPAPAFAVDAHIVAAQGSVSIDRNSETWAVSAGESVGAHRTVATGQDGFARLEVAGGEWIEVYANSRVIFQQNAANPGDLLDVLAGRARVHLNPRPGEPQQRVFCRVAVVAAHEPATFGVAIDEDGNVRIDVLEGVVGVQHALLPNSEPTLVKAIDAIVVEKDEKISRRMERGTLYRYTVKPLHQLFEALTSGRSGGRVQEQPLLPPLLVASKIL
jgi:hypothetical protein